MFASPHHQQITEAATVATTKTDSDSVLLIVMNHTGDTVTFAIAAEKLRANGVRVLQVRVDDDIATSSSGAGRRGMAAAVVEKILGAAADQGATLDELASLGNRITAHSCSLAVAARAHTSLATRKPAFTLAREHYYGVGIRRTRNGSTLDAREPVDELLRRVIADLLASAAHSTEPHGVLLLVNGLGATTNLELTAISSLAHKQLTHQGVTVAALSVGTYATALDIAGFSLTLTTLDHGWLDLWCAPTDTPLRLQAAISPARTPP
ncbi:dihydroxyacetone kinase subunit DhaK [Streptomyces sp. NPDC056909]|uniref:dihydroxyacetone kinase subunit DhaK n=1 Tax=Streptomyces sp. NPDC056909 TaxID=3345963 RepID=UPI0036951A00